MLVPITKRPINKYLPLLTKISLLYLGCLFLLELIIDTKEAFSSFDNWVWDFYRSVVIFLQIIFGSFVVVKSRKIKKLLQTKSLTPLISAVIIIFSVITLSSLLNFSIEVKYNLDLDKKMQTLFPFSHDNFVTSEMYTKEKNQGELLPSSSILKELGEPDKIVKANDRYFGGDIEQWNYCVTPTEKKRCHGYQIMVKEGYVTGMLPYWGQHKFESMRELLYENWIYNRFFGLLAFKDFS